jgi:hypothetical protein
MTWRAEPGTAITSARSDSVKLTSLGCSQYGALILQMRIKWPYDLQLGIIFLFKPDSCILTGQ